MNVIDFQNDKKAVIACGLEINGVKAVVVTEEGATTNGNAVKRLYRCTVDGVAIEGWYPRRGLVDLANGIEPSKASGRAASCGDGRAAEGAGRSHTRRTTSAPLTDAQAGREFLGNWAQQCRVAQKALEGLSTLSGYVDCTRDALELSVADAVDFVAKKIAANENAATVGKLKADLESFEKAAAASEAAAAALAPIIEAKRAEIEAAVDSDRVKEVTALLYEQCPGVDSKAMLSTLERVKAANGGAAADGAAADGAAADGAAADGAAADGAEEKPSNKSNQRKKSA